MNGSCYVIAEAGINHNGDLGTALKLVDAAAAAGCDAVKFQRRSVHRVYSQPELDSPRPNPFGPTNGDLKRGLELSDEAYRRVMAHASAAGLDCFVSVWDEQSVADAAAMGPPYLKLPSPLIGHRRVLEAARSTGIPVLLSTGGSDLATVRVAVDVLGTSLAALMHCVSAYPCPIDSVNLRQMLTLRQEFGVPVGYSSHEMSPHAVWAAVALGAEVVERHLTLDRTIWGSDQAMSTEPADMAELVAGIRSVTACLGAPEVVRLPIEQAAVEKLFRTADKG